MFPTTLITALLVSTPGPKPSVQDSMLARVADDCEVVFYIGDTAAMLANPEESGIATFLTDSRVTDAFQMLFDGVEDEAGPLMAGSMSVFQDMHGAAVGISTSSGNGRVALRGTDELLPKLMEFLTSAVGSEAEELEHDGQVCYAFDDQENRLVLVQVDGEILISAEEMGALSQEDQVQDVVERLAQQPVADSRLWWEALAERPSDPTFELFIGTAAFEGEVDPELQMFFDSVGGIYFGFSEEGPGEMEAAMAVTYESSELMLDLSAVFESGDLELLKLAPSDAVGVGVGRMDVQGLVEAIVGFVESLEPGISGQYEDGLEAAESVLGFDIEEGIFDNMTGDYFVVQWEQDAESVMLGEEDFGAALENLGTFGAFFQDSEPLWTLLELAEQAAGPDVITTRSGDGYDGWGISVMEGAEFFVALTDSGIFLGTEEHVLAVIERLGAEEADGFVTPSMMKTAEDVTEGMGWSVFSSHSFLDTALDAFELGIQEEFAAPGEKVEVAVDMAEALREVIGDVMYIDTTIAEDRFVLRLVAR